MSKAIKIKKGIDIKLIGEAEVKFLTVSAPSSFALKPDDFFGLIPKLSVKEGEEVKAGTPLFYDKANEKVVFVSPVSGEVAEIRRGDKRKILEVRILADQKNSYVEYGALPDSASRGEIVNRMLTMGLWPFVKQRPFGIIARPDDSPRDIFISAYDSAPLAPSVSFLLREEKKQFQAGIDILRKLTTGRVYVGYKKGDGFFADVKGAELVEISGPHPAGNVGVLIHHVAPINKGEVVWTVGATDVALIGRSLEAGRFLGERIIAMTGSEIKQTGFVKTLIGAQLGSLLKDNVAEGDVRIISGNVLTGTKEHMGGYLGFYHNQITAIPEGNKKQFFLTEGWLSPGLNKFSLSKAYPSWLLGNKRYKLDTNLNGEHRAFVVTGEMEKVFPFDIYPMQLIKAIMVNDIDAMEKLGIYEVDAEDFALCEFVCTSKVDIQDVVRKGIADMVKEFAS
jgi:Na+-transporting NADH:ubiquinone oxidoreductase subunit A